jgi:hypothetical protein
MPVGRITTRFGQELDLPPPFRPVALREVGDAFDHASTIAAAEGAGTVVHVGRLDLAEFAVVLEPAETLRAARRSFYLGMIALGDALAGFAMAEKPIRFDWPGSVRVDGGLVGGGRLGWPPDAAEDSVPKWLVFGAMIRTVSIGSGEPGLLPLGTALDEEGFEDPGSGRLLESFCRHFMAVLDLYEERGFDALAPRYLDRLARMRAGRSEIDMEGCLLIRSSAGQEIDRRPLAAALAAPDWLDPTTGGPRK